MWPLNFKREFSSGFDGDREERGRAVKMIEEQQHVFGYCSGLALKELCFYLVQLSSSASFLFASVAAMNPSRRKRHRSSINDKTKYFTTPVRAKGMTSAKAPRRRFLEPGEISRFVLGDSLVNAPGESNGFSQMNKQKTFQFHSQPRVSLLADFPSQHSPEDLSCVMPSDGFGLERTSLSRGNSSIDQRRTTSIIAAMQMSGAPHSVERPATHQESS